MCTLLTACTSANNKSVESIHWRIAGSVPPAMGQEKALGLAGAIAGKINDLLIIAGGSNFPDSMPWLGGKKRYYDEVHVLQQNSDGIFVAQATSKLPLRVGYSASCATPLGVLSAGGENEKGIINTAFLLQWDNSKKNTTILSLPDIPLPISNASVACINNIVYLSGGETNNGVSKGFFQLDLLNISAGWIGLPSLPKAVSHAVMVAQSDGDHECIYLFGGRRKRIDSVSELYATNFQFDLETNNWTEKHSLPYALSAGTGVPIGSDDILLCGGDQGNTFHQSEELILAISQEMNAAKKRQLNEDKVRIQSQHPGFSKEALLYNTHTDSWSTLNPLTFTVPVTTTAVLWGNSIVIPGGEIKAGVRSPDILVGEIKHN